MIEEKLGAKVVVIGGGTGSFTLLNGLKHYARNITALVKMADDGGSTGHLRDELGVLPPGDIRQCLVALSDNPRVRELFNYRFDEGSLKGHAFGNLFLTALEKMTGNFGHAVELAGQVLNITGQVEPITLADVTLCAEGRDGELKGEFKIAQASLKPRPKVWLEPTAKANPAALQAIDEADLVIIAPGNLYGSLAPALVVDGISQALQKTKAKRIYVSNLVTKPGQTEGFDVTDFAAEIERLAGGPFLDYVIYNTLKPPKDLMERYAHEGEYLVELDQSKADNLNYRLSGRPILAKGGWGEAQAADEISATRSFIRHDSDAVARAIMRLYFD
jgi:uncharacterized cofD-like protein